MKKILFLLLAFPALAFGQETRTQATNTLMGLGMPGQLAEQVAGLSTGLGVISNNVALKWRNAAGSANVDVLNLTGSNSVALAPSSTLIINGTSASTYFGGNLYGDGANIIGIDTADAADSSLLNLTGASAVGTTRAGSLILYGNENAAAGDVNITAGDAAGGNVTLNASNAAGTVIFQTASANRWVLEADGDLTSQATNGGDLNISSLGKTISIQESTPGSACMGSFTANGATPVVVSTTCAATTMRTLFTKTSTSAVNGSCYRSAISNGVSFTVTCLATDTGTYDWFIIKEAP